MRKLCASVKTLPKNIRKNMEERRQRPFIKQAAMQLVAGGSAGEVFYYFVDIGQILHDNVIFRLHRGEHNASSGLGQDSLPASIVHTSPAKRQPCELTYETPFKWTCIYNCLRQFQVHYDGVADCMRKMYRSEGVLSFWKGVLPPILVETPKRAWKVWFYFHIILIISLLLKLLHLSFLLVLHFRAVQDGIQVLRDAIASTCKDSHLLFHH